MAAAEDPDEQDHDSEPAEPLRERPPEQQRARQRFHLPEDRGPGGGKPRGRLEETVHDEAGAEDADVGQRAESGGEAPGEHDELIDPGPARGRAGARAMERNPVGQPAQHERNGGRRRESGPGGLAQPQRQGEGDEHRHPQRAGQPTEEGEDSGAVHGQRQRGRRSRLMRAGCRTTAPARRAANPAGPTRRPRPGS